MAVYNFRDVHLLYMYSRQLCYNAKSSIDILIINKWITGEDFNSPHIHVKQNIWRPVERVAMWIAGS